MIGISTISQITPAFQPQDAKSRHTTEEPLPKDPLEQEGKRLLELSQAERREVERLVQRDREVKAHEQAHKAAAGSYARGAASFDYETGPDGKRYAVGGEVDIDISKQTDPETNLKKAQTIKRAALAPADPSIQDRRIAAQARMMEVEAQQDLLRQQVESVNTLSTQENARGDVDDSSSMTPSRLRALNLYQSVESSATSIPQSPFDQVI